MFLVLMRHSSDDLPLALFSSRERAESFAKSIDWEGVESHASQNVLKLDATTPIAILIVEFAISHQGGYLPVLCDCIRSYDDELTTPTAN